MELQKIFPGKRLAYANHKTSGVFTVREVAPHPSNGVTWVRGYDKDKKKDIAVFPSQVSAVRRG